MPKILKATLGVAFLKPMFRLSTLSGQLADDLLKLRGHAIPAGDFDSIARDQQNTTLSLYNANSSVLFNISQADATYTFDLYDSDGIFSFEKLFVQFQAIWNTADATLKFPAIRRIGFVTEQRLSTGVKSNDLLMDRLTTIKPNGFPARFHLTYDERLNSGHGGLPDPTKDDFINVIRTYYDSALDGQHSEPDAINANLDVQRYYTPPLTGSPFEEIKRLKIEYDKAAVKFNSDLEKMDSSYAKAA